MLELDPAVVSVTCEKEDDTSDELSTFSQAKTTSMPRDNTMVQGSGATKLSPFVRKDVCVHL